jgi:hypothetical protein
MLVLMVGVVPAFAETAAPWWHVNIDARPSVLTAGRERTVVVSVTNLGDKEAIGEAGDPVVVMDTLPEGIEAEKGSGAGKERAFYIVGPKGTSGGGRCTVGLVLPTVSMVGCSFEGVITPYLSLEADIYVSVEKGLVEEVEKGLASGKQKDEVEPKDEVSVAGGGAPAVSTGGLLTVGTGSTGFGVEVFESVPENVGGSVDTQAGSHPFQWTTTLVLNAGAETEPEGIEDHERSNEEFGPVAQPALPKDLRLNMPPGMVGDPSAFAKCTEGEFKILKCPASAQIGVVVVTVADPLDSMEAVPLFNMVPARGEPARFGFNDMGSPVFFDISVRTGGDYGLTVSSNNITQTAAFLSAQFTVWGWPGDPRHDSSRGYGCVGLGILEFGCSSSEDTVSAPFLSLPTACGVNPSEEPFEMSIEGDSWPEPASGDSSEPVGDWQSFIQGPVPYVLRDGTDSSIGLDGCDKLSFEPSIKVTPDSSEASKPSGLNVDVHVPQHEVLIPNGLAESDVKGITVALPEGVAVNPAGSDGLEACSEKEIGFTGVGSGGMDLFTSGLPAPAGAPAEPFCPNGSKIGTVKTRTPLLEHELEGAVYLASQEANPFGSLVATYLVMEDPVSGVLVKLPGQVRLCQNAGETIFGMACQGAGQIITSFENSPQLPFEDAELHFFGGERAPLATPALCKGRPATANEPGEEGYRTVASISPWSGNEPVGSSSEFDVTTGPNGSPCPNGRPFSPSLSQLPFAPSLTVGTTSNQAGGFSPFTMTMSRADGNQPLRGVKLVMPPGLLGMLSSVKPCEEAQANAGTCGPESLIGETTVSVGVGGQPYTVTGGKVYITGPYNGAPYGLSIVNPAKAGPFDLEHTAVHSPPCDCLIVRAKIEVNPLTAALTVTANSGGEDSIPTILEGIPLQIKHVNVTINRSGFTFNPTNCDPLHIGGTLTSSEGALASLPVPFQVTNCAALAFKPTFAGATAGHTSRTEGASLTTTVTYPSTPQGTEANIAKVKVSLPAKLPARLTTLQKACTEQTFAENPADCPAASRIGQATTKTPVLPNPLSGPAYFVSHGGAKYPELVIELKGDNVTIDLHGETAISKKGVLTSTFNAVPDAPFSSFELNLPKGRYSALTANGANLCKAGSLTMPTELIAQDGGAPIKQNTKVKITGCSKNKPKSKHKSKGGKHKK